MTMILVREEEGKPRRTLKETKGSNGRVGCQLDEEGRNDDQNSLDDGVGVKSERVYSRTIVLLESVEPRSGEIEGT